MEEAREVYHSISPEHRSRFGIALLVALVFLSVFLVTKTITEIREWRFIGSGVIPSNTISVQGVGEVFAVPDIATFTFSVIKEGASAADVQEDAARSANAIIDFLKGEGIEEKDIKTVNYSVYPRYEYEQRVCITFPCPQEERQLVGFEINQSVQVKVRETTRAGELLSGVGELGAEQISGLSFTIDDEDALKREARKQAVADAREKAKALADDLGVRLVRIVNFNEYDSPIYYGREFGVAAGMGGDSKVVPELPTGENQILSQVNITYEIR